VKCGCCEDSEEPIRYRTDYHGWSVRAEREHVGLFIARQHAVNDAEKRRAKLSATGRDSTATMAGSDADPLLNDRSSRSIWSRRQL
jgi:hypothetical protein